MRYKLLVCVFVLLIATPVLAQEFSPIIIETGKPVPSVVRSGEPFKVTYRAKFLDTVLIYEEQMQPDSLALEKIEVISLEIDKNPLRRQEDESLGFVNVWDFTYTFRIIQPEKGEYKIIPFNFVWVSKKAGVTIEETKEKEKLNEFLTEEVGVSYITSTVKPPPLDIRDEIVFISPIVDGDVLRRGAYGVIGIASLLTVTILFWFAKYPKIRQSREVGRENVEIAEGDAVDNVEPILLPKQARKKFLVELKKLKLRFGIWAKEGPVLAAENRRILEKNIRSLVRALLLAELRGTIRTSMSENEIYVKLSSLELKEKKKIGSKYGVVVDLAGRLKGYQEDVDSEKYSLDVAGEIVELRKMVSGLSFYKRFLFFVKNLFGRRH